MSTLHDFSQDDEAGYYAFTEDAQLEMIQVRDRLAMYADMMAVAPAEPDDSALVLGARDLQACFLSLAGEMTRLLQGGQWRPVD